MTIDATTNSEPFRIVLAAGRSLHLRVVDWNGQPIKATIGYDARVGAGKPRGYQTANQARFSGISGENGEVVWSNAPAGELYFSVFAKGAMALRDTKVGADESEHTFTLSPALTVRGTVRDAETGENIPRFRIVSGFPQNRTGQDPLHLQWSPLERDWLSFSGGKFRHTYTEALLGGPANPGYVLKFEAEGYAPMISRWIRPDEGDVQLDVKLRKRDERIITVLLPSGRPAANADVGLSMRGAWLELGPGSFSRHNLRNPAALLRADDQGQFRYASDPEVERLFIVHEDGYLETSPAALVTQSKVQLAAWGRLEGRFFKEGKPVADAELMPGFPANGMDRSAIAFGFPGYTVKSDADGRYVFPRFPAGRFQLIHLVTGLINGTSKSWAPTSLGVVDVRPGETTTNNIGVLVCSVTGRWRLPEALAARPHLDILATLHTPIPEPPVEIMADFKALHAWNIAPERAGILRASRHFQLVKGSDGAWTGSDIPPGEYAITARAVERDDANPPFKLLGLGRRRDIIIPADAVGTALDLGEVVLEAVPAK